VVAAESSSESELSSTALVESAQRERRETQRVGEGMTFISGLFYKDKTQSSAAVALLSMGGMEPYFLQSNSV